MALITLRVLDGADRGRVFEDVPTPLTIGREEGNPVQLNDERISRFHLKIQEDQEKVVLTDLDGNITYANPSFERTSGYTVTEALGQNPRVLKSGHHDKASPRRNRS